MPRLVASNLSLNEMDRLLLEITNAKNDLLLRQEKLTEPKVDLTIEISSPAEDRNDQISPFSCLQEYIQRFTGQKDGPVKALPIPPPIVILFAWLGSFTSICILAALSQYQTFGKGHVMIVGSFGAQVSLVKLANLLLKLCLYTQSLLSRQGGSSFRCATSAVFTALELYNGKYLISYNWSDSASMGR